MVPGDCRHRFQDCLQIQLFHIGIYGQTKKIIDVAITRSLMSKTISHAYALLKETTANNYLFPNERNLLRKVTSVLDVNPS